MPDVVLFQSKEEAVTTIPHGKIKLIRFDNQEWCIANIKDSFYVFQKTCPHMDYPFIQGHLNNRLEVICPWHVHRFSLKTGEECFGRSGPLKTLPVEWKEDCLVIKY